jgi:hypothetical protein
MIRAGVLVGASILVASPCFPDAGSLPSETSVPLATVEFSGHRYVARAEFGLGRSVPLMVHGNASMFLTLTHAVGEKLHGGPVPKTENYGYSSRGKGILRVARMKLGGKTYSRIPPVSVFDYTETGDTLVQGMVGVPFLLGSRAAVDFPHDLLLLGVVTRSRPDPRLRARGYVSVPMVIHEGKRVTVSVRFPALNRVLPITPSTVSSALTLHAPLFKGKVPMKAAPSPDRSPHGTTPDVYLSDRVDFEIAGAKLESAASFEDLAEYGKVSEGALESYGMLGYDWMKEHQAVLDYANRLLYFKPTPAGGSPSSDKRSDRGGAIPREGAARAPRDRA